MLHEQVRVGAAVQLMHVVGEVLEEVKSESRAQYAIAASAIQATRPGLAVPAQTAQRDGTFLSSVEKKPEGSQVPHALTTIVLHLHLFFYKGPPKKPHHFVLALARVDFDRMRIHVNDHSAKSWPSHGASSCGNVGQHVLCLVLAVPPPHELHDPLPVRDGSFHRLGITNVTLLWPTPNYTFGLALLLRHEGGEGRHGARRGCPWLTARKREGDAARSQST